MAWVLKTCCFCCHLRDGLLVYGYIGLILNYISILLTLFHMQDELDSPKPSEPISFMKQSATFGFLIIHFIFSLILVAGLHKKSRGMLEVYNGYNVITTILLAVFSSLYIPVRAYKLSQLLEKDVWIFVLIGLFSTLTTLLLQLYLVMLVRSVILDFDEEKEFACQSLDTDNDPNCSLQYFKKRKEFDEC